MHKLFALLLSIKWYGRSHQFKTNLQIFVVNIMGTYKIHVFKSTYSYNKTHEIF